MHYVQGGYLEMPRDYTEHPLFKQVTFESIYKAMTRIDAIINKNFVPNCVEGIILKYQCYPECFVQLPALVDIPTLQDVKVDLR